MVEILTKLRSWFRKAHWLQALLCFSVFSIFGALAGFLWWGYTAERIQGFNDEQREMQERAQTAEMEQDVLQSGLEGGMFGLVSYGVLFLLLKKHYAKKS